MAQGGVINVQFKTGGMVQGPLVYLSSTTKGMHSNIYSNHYKRKVLGQDVDKVLSIINGTTFIPAKCNARKGGPRSKIFCEQFNVGEHSEHVGKSNTGRWYKWRNDDFREQSQELFQDVQE